MTFEEWHDRDSGIAGAETTAVVLITLGLYDPRSLARARYLHSGVQKILAIFSNEKAQRKKKMNDTDFF